MASEAWVTLATNDSYAIGVLVLANSLQAVKSSRPLVVMITNQVSSAMRLVFLGFNYSNDKRLNISTIVTLRARLAEVALVQEVNVMDSADTAHLALLARPELGITFTKLHCWTLIQYSKCVFLDADTLVCYSLNVFFYTLILFIHYFVFPCTDCPELWWALW